MKRVFLIVATLALVLLQLPDSCFAQHTLPVKRPPNIVLIVSDDHAYQAISAYRHDLINTPNIDRIGREGAIMRKAYVTNSVCSPSRAVILTGKYSHLNGLRDNGSFFDSTQQTFPKILQQHGYKTAVIGKWHLWSAPTGFDYWNILPAQGHYYNPDFIKMGKDTAYTGYVTDVITDLSVQWMNQNKQYPFCLLLYNKAPHRNWMPPLKYLDECNNHTFSPPANFYDDYKDRAGLQRQHITIANDLDLKYDSKIICDSCKPAAINDWAPAEFQREIERLTPAEKKVWDAAYAGEQEVFKQLRTNDERVRFQFQRYMEDYLRCIHSVDDNTGRVLRWLDSSGLAGNTIVIYMSDQGVYLGEHGLYDKRFMYEESFRTPMLIRFPALISPAQKIDAFALNLDIAPTVLDLAGITVPSAMQGVSMKKLLQKGTDEHWRKEIYYHYYERSFGLTPHYGIKTSRYKLMHFYGAVNTWELYDLKNDSAEMKNLADDSKYGRVRQELEKRLRFWQRYYKDPVKE